MFCLLMFLALAKWEITGQSYGKTGKMQNYQFKNTIRRIILYFCDGVL